MQSVSEAGQDHLTRALRKCPYFQINNKVTVRERKGKDRRERRGRRAAMELISSSTRRQLETIVTNWCSFIYQRAKGRRWRQLLRLPLLAAFSLPLDSFLILSISFPALFIYVHPPVALPLRSALIIFSLHICRRRTVQLCVSLGYSAVIIHYRSVQNTDFFILTLEFGVQGDVTSVWYIYFDVI